MEFPLDVALHTDVLANITVNVVAGNSDQSVAKRLRKCGAFFIELLSMKSQRPSPRKSKDYRKPVATRDSHARSAAFHRGRAIGFSVVCCSITRPGTRLPIWSPIPISTATSTGGFSGRSAILLENANPADVVTVAEASTQREGADRRPAYLGELAANTPSAANIRRYAEIVRERAVLRQLVATADEIAADALNPLGRDAETLLDEAGPRSSPSPKPAPGTMKVSCTSTRC